MESQTRKGVRSLGVSTEVNRRVQRVGRAEQRSLGDPKSIALGDGDEQDTADGFINSRRGCVQFRAERRNFRRDSVDLFIVLSAFPPLGFPWGFRVKINESRRGRAPARAPRAGEEQGAQSPPLSPQPAPLLALPPLPV